MEELEDVPAQSLDVLMVNGGPVSGLDSGCAMAANGR